MHGAVRQRPAGEEGGVDRNGLRRVGVPDDFPWIPRGDPVDSVKEQVHVPLESSLQWTGRVCRADQPRREVVISGLRHTARWSPESSEIRVPRIPVVA